MVANAIHTMLGGKTVKILVVCLSPSRPLIGTDLTACFGGTLPVMLASV